jgi:plastocyanin
MLTLMSALSSPVGHGQGKELTTVQVTIRAREFQPATVKLLAGEDVLLVLQNQDAELHAFAPQQFLDAIPLHVDGNGAPEFGEHGLVRIMIPSGGRASLRFRLQEAGLYEYRCDLPGHRMVGHISVE